MDFKAKMIWNSFESNNWRKKKEVSSEILEQRNQSRSPSREGLRERDQLHLGQLVMVTSVTIHSTNRATYTGVTQTPLE